MDRLTDEALTTLAELAEKATPGPWTYDGKADESVRGQNASASIADTYSKTRTAAYLTRCDPQTILRLVEEVGKRREGWWTHPITGEWFPPVTWKRVDP